MKDRDEYDERQIMYDGIVDARNFLVAKEEAFLRRFGWKSSCKNPAGLWLWQKEIEGQIFSVDTDIAVDIELGME